MADAKSFVVSVFPVPAGPAGEHPIFKCNAWVAVTYIRSVKGVTTKRSPFPKYSYPYIIEASQTSKWQSSFCGSQYAFIWDCHIKSSVLFTFSWISLSITSLECVSLLIKTITFAIVSSVKSSKIRLIR